MPASYPSRASRPAILRGCLGVVAWLLPSFAWAQLVEVQQVSEPAGFVSETKVVEVGSSFTTLLPELSSNGYIFGYWTAGSNRLADANGRSLVQAEMSIAEGITLTAYYFPEAEDTDSDGVRDWFEWRNFGTLYQGQQEDSDGDGFTNGQEDALGQEPTIFDEVEDGGVTARRSPLFIYRDTSMMKYTMKSDPLGFVETTERYLEINGSTTSANLHGESNGYTFAYWSVNGERQAAGSGVAVSQVTTRVEGTTVAIAHYLPTGEDSDGDGVADWFELNQFGDLNNGPDDDPDGDQFPNALEEALGQEATIRDEVEDGGITARRSPSFTYRDTSMVAYTFKSDPPGFVEETTGYVEQNASVTTPNLHGESNGYTFAYWSVNGVRQVSPNGLSLSQVTVEINATATFIAHYLVTTEDSDGDGVEDWFEMYQFGNLDQSPEGDFDGDGFSNKKENELGQEALVRDEVEDGGITARRSKSVLYFQQQNYAPSDLELNNTIIFTYQASGSLVGGFTPTDLNDANLQDTYNYSLLTGPGGEDYALYSISENRLQTASEFTSETNHSLLVRVADSGGEYLDKNFTIHVLDPALDPDGDGLTNQQEWLAGTRHDHPDSDGDGFSDSAEITAGTNPLDAEDFPNAAPTDLNSTDLLTVAENQPAGTLVGEFNATDPDGDVIVYSLVSGQGDTDNDFFLLDENGTLTTASVLDYEAGDTRTIRVQASDPHGAITQGIFTVQVTNDEADDVEVTFTVSGGQHQAPFFTFIDQNGDTPDFSTLRLKKGKTYEFVASGISSGHTFMIGESYGDTSSSSVTGNPLNSYQNGAKLVISIPEDFSGKLYYFCTYHDTMIQELLVGRPQHIVDLNSSVSLEMIWVEPGTFMMGSPETEAGRRNDEPQHKVTLTKGFYLGKYEVTQAQYEAVMTGNTEIDSNGNVISATPSNWPNNPDRPVEMVSWEDIQVFLTRLNAQEAGNIPTGWAYVLPTEAQWEYACRADTTTAYSWGDIITTSDANYGNTIGQTTNVGSYSANPWGFFDMHGNVYEWTADASGTYASGAQTDPFNAGTMDSNRVIRGGSWQLPATDLRSALRLGGTPSARRNHIGFRLAFRQITEPPVNLNSVAELTVSENQPIGTIVGEFNATDPDGESRYEIISGVEMSWQEAREDALSRGGHLVTITSQEENNLITGLLESAGYPDDGPYWIGMHEVGQGGSSAGQFQWVTEEEIDYTNWIAGRPEYNGYTRAVYIQSINNSNFGKWSDGREEINVRLNGYILELPPAVSYHLVAGEGDGNNSLFTLDQNGTLKTASVLDYEEGNSLTIRVQAKDEYNASVEDNFTVGVQKEIIRVHLAGIPKVGEWLSVSNTIPNEGDLGTISYQWLKDGVPVRVGGTTSENLSGEVRDIILSLDQRHLYVAGTADDSIVWFDRNTSTGSLTYGGKVKNGFNGVTGLNSVRGLAFSRSGKFLYAAGNYGNSICWFVRDEFDGSLTQGGLLRDGSNGIVDGLKGARSVVVSPDDKSVYVTAYADNAVSWYEINSTSGALTYKGMLHDDLYGVDGLNSAWGMAIVEDGDHVLIAGANDMTISWFRRNELTGDLTFEGLLRDGTDGVDGLSGPQHVKVSPDGRFVYVTANFDNSISWFERNLTNGELTYQGVIKDGAGGVDGLYRPSGLELSPNGDFLYVTSTEDDAVSCFDRNKTTGSLEFISVFKDGIDGINGMDRPFGITTSSNGDFLYVSASTDSAVTWFGRDKASGDLIHFEGNESSYLVQESDLGSTINVVAYLEDENGNMQSFSSSEIFIQRTRAPTDLNSLDVLIISENQPVGTVVGQFNATDPDGDAISYHLVSGEVDGNNSLFTLDQNGTLKTAAVLDYETGDTLFIRVQAKDELNATVEVDFTVGVLDVYEPRPNHFADLNSTVSLEMIWVEPGTFTMGSPETEVTRSSNETQHEVTLTKGFYLGKYEVTQAQYEAVMTGNIDGLSATPSNFAGNPNRPVEQVSWDDIQKFLIRLNTQEAGNVPAGWAYVLPTEAQWEYACRAGTTTAYSWGDTITSDDANYNWDGDWNTGADFQQTCDIGQYSANYWGFFDMHGNVHEWTADAWGTNASGAQTDPLNAGATDSFRVHRGSYWGDTGPNLRSAARYSSDPSYRHYGIGFRVGFKQIEEVDEVFPELELFGGTAIIHKLGEPWAEPGFDASDERDGNLTSSVTISGSVDIDTAGTYILTYSVSDTSGNEATVTRTVQVLHELIEFNSANLLTIAENKPVGTLVGEFMGTHEGGNAVFFQLVGGEGDVDNALFNLTDEGLLTNAEVFDFEEAETRSIRVEATDFLGTSVFKQFTVLIEDDPEGEIKLEQDEFFTDGKSLEIGGLKILGMDDVNFSMGPDADGGMHLFILSQDGELKLTEHPRESKTYELKILVFNENGILAERIVVVNVTAPQKEDLHAANTSDSAYHESALMIRALEVVQGNWRNGHNPISSIGTRQETDGLFVTTAEPHGRKVGDSVVLSGVKGLRIEGIKNWNFLIDEVSEKSFRIRHFAKNAEGKPDGRLGQLAKQVTGTAYQTSGSDYLLGPWTFGHLIGNMVSEKDDPVEFYKHFANQWKNRQTVNGWSTDDRPNTHNAMVPQVDGGLALSNLPFRLLAIGNRIDLFHAKSMRQVADAGEGRFVFTMTNPFPLPQQESSIWKVHEKTRDEPFYTLIFEYGQPAGDFATLAKWAKDWHMLQRENLHNVDEEYFQRLNDLTDRFNKRGSDIRKPNANPINQVRTNDFIQSPLWQMREFNLVSKETAHQVKAAPDRETKLVVDEAFQSIDIGLWTTTTKNNPMVRENGLDEELEKPLARWINQRENYIVGADVGPRAPEWMEGPVANEPHGFSYNFQSENIRGNLARYKYSLSTCSGCHTGDTGTFFQMVVSSGRNQRAFFAPFMVGNGSGGMHVVNDHENFEEKHEFFDLKGREEIARDILEISQQVDAARIRLTRTEIRFDGLAAPSHVFVSEGILSDWEFELPSGREDNDFYTLNASTGEISLRNNQERPPFGSGKIFLRARATDGTGVVIERPYSLWILVGDEERLADDLDPTMLPVEVPPFVTPRPNRTH